MQEELLAEYITLLCHYDHLLQQLYHVLEPSIQLTGFVHGGSAFTPTEPTIQRQIRHWPEGLFLYPPVSWVHLRKGAFVLDGQRWTFAFHGGGLSFFHQESERDVSGEFTRDGTLAFTAYTFWCYLVTNPTSSAAFAALGSLHEFLFKETAERNIITPVEPLLEGDDLTFLMNSLEVGAQHL